MSRHRPTPAFTVLIAGLSIFGAKPAAFGQVVDYYYPVVESGDPVPGGSGAFASFDGVILHGDRVIFRATSTLPQESGVFWVGPGSGPHLVAAPTTAVPGGDSGSFSEFQDLSGIVAPSESVAFGGLGSQGEFGIYAAPVLLPGPINNVVDHNTMIPPNNGGFLAFESLSLLAGRVAFLGAGSIPQNTGLYVAGVEPPPPLQNQGALLRIADLTTPVPGGNGGTFTEFGELTGIVAPSESVAFGGLGSQGEVGVYHVRLDQPANIAVLADQNTPIPGSNGSLSSIVAVDLDVNQAVLYALATIDEDTGIYAAGVEPPPPLGGAAGAGPSLRLIANKTTPVPGGAGPFAGFGEVAAAEGRAAFVGVDGQGQRGIYGEIAGVLREVVAAGDVLPPSRRARNGVEDLAGGGTVADVAMTDEAMDGADLAVLVRFSDQSEAIYLIDVTGIFADGFESGDTAAWSGTVP
jgi:hypothetical protein